MCIYLLNIVLNSASCAFNGFLMNLIGAAVMNRANHPGYFAIPSGRQGAVGGAILGVIPGLFGGSQSEESSTNVPFLALGVGVALGALEGVIGSAIFDSAHVAARQAVKQSAISGAVGTAVVAGAISVLAGLILIGFAIGSAFKLCCCAPEDPDKTMADSVAAFELKERQQKEKTDQSPV